MSQTSRTTSRSETTRTYVFVAAAFVSVVLTLTADVLTRPGAPEGSEQLGMEFYPEFTDASAATSLDVVVYDDETAAVRQFMVEQQPNGLWTIPSHHDYPADAKDHLARTAASIMGITRGAMQSRRDTDHERYGVLDPLDSDDTRLKGRGQRITLTGDDESTLADYIIGNKAKRQDNVYYVRTPKDNVTYLAKLDIDLSTKFSDWIESDLLKADRDDFREIVIHKYSIDEQRGLLADQEISTLTREKSTDPWNLDGLNEEAEEINKDDVRELVNSLDDLKLVGVRPKPEGLNPDLTVDAKIRSGLIIDAMIYDLRNKGFVVASGTEESDDLRLLANEGELHAATDEGVVYELYFGEIYTGTSEELETGFSKETDEEQDDASDDASDNRNNDLKSSRYLFLRTRFVEKHLGEKPAKPVEPEKPAGLEDDSDNAQQESGNTGGEENANNDEDPENEQNTQDESKNDDNKDGDNSEEEDGAEKLKKEWEDAKRKYEDDLRNYESDLAEYERKAKDGREQADELNRRFANWYYVISSDSFEKLRLSRSQLIKEKEKVEDGEEDQGSTSPNQTPTGDEPTPTGDAATKPEKDSDDGNPENKDTEGETANETPSEKDAPTESESDGRDVESGDDRSPPPSADTGTDDNSAKSEDADPRAEDSNSAETPN